MRQQIKKSHLLIGLLAALCWLNSSPSLAQSALQFQEQGSEQLQPQAQNQAPSLALVNWPGALAYPRTKENLPVMPLQAGQQVELLERADPWWKIRLGDKEGWIHRFLIEPLAASESQQPMLDLDAVWKPRLDARAALSNSTERFTAQLMKNSKTAWAPQVIAPARLVIGKDNFKLWVKTPKAGYVYVWSETEDGELTLVFPNQRDADNQVLAGQVLYLPRNNWPIKSTGPAGLARLFVMVSELPRALPPPESLMQEIADATLPFLPSVSNGVDENVLKRHPFWMSTRTTLNANPALSYFLNPDFSGENCNPKKPQCSNTYGVKSVKLMKVEPEP